jgi:UDP-glucose 4-epimerase
MKLIAGATGVLGSGFVDVLRRRGEPYVAMQVPWGDPSGAAERVVSYWRAAEEAAPESPITLVWAAGTGTVGASDAAMAAETATLAAVVEALAGAVWPDPANRLLFTSSAGAIYGGHGTGVIDESTTPAPITPYGREKLAQEALVAQLAEAGVIGAVVCRFTNVYGLADGRLRRKGLVPALVEAAMLRQPVRLFVSPDTRRDYLFNVDAARLALAEVEGATAGTTAGAVQGAATAGATGALAMGAVEGAAAGAAAGTTAGAGAVESAVAAADARAHEHWGVRVASSPGGVRAIGSATDLRMAIVRSGQTATVLDLVGSVSRVLRRRVPVVITESPENRVQPLVLRFRERRGIQATIPTTSFEAAVRSMAEAPRG